MVRLLPGKILRGFPRAGMLAGAILIALALLLLFRGFGLGGSGTTGAGSAEAEADSQTTLITTSVPARTETSASGGVPVSGGTGREDGLSDDERKALSGNVLSVLIDEHDYRLQLPDAAEPAYVTVPLQRIVELAGFAKGDSNGIRVRILRRESSRASAEERLKLELAQIGIGPEHLVMPGDFVP